MRDMTEGPLTGHIIAMAAPMAVGMLVQTLYFVVDLYFIGHLGDAALAGVSAAGTMVYVVMALTQALGVGAVTLIAHAVGRKDREDANLVFNQSVALAGACAAALLVLGYGFAGAFVSTLAADAATRDLGLAYLYWYLPGLALQFAVVVMASALRGTGIVKPAMVTQGVSVLVNTALAPVLIAGWGTGIALGVAGAGIASSIAVIVSVLLLAAYFLRLEHYVGFNAAMLKPRLAVWRRMLDLGLPAGGEFLLMFVYMAIVYWLIRDFGAAAQAGFGLGSRITTAFFLPAMAVAFTVPAVAGQNFGAKRYDRVRETFTRSALIGAAMMAMLALIVHIDPAFMARPFSRDPEVVAFAARFLEIVSWNFVATGLIFTCSGMFQALGNTWPSLLSSASRLLTFAVPAVWLSHQPGFTMDHVWYLSVGTMTLQAVASVLLVRWQMDKRLVAA